MFVIRTSRIRSAALWLSRKRFFKRCSSTTADQPVAFEKKSQDLGPTTKPFKQPFLKNIFLGKFDQDLLVYPEVIDHEEVREKFVEKVRMEASSDGHLMKLTVPDRVKSIFKSGVPLVSDAQTFDSERASMYESLGIDLQTALLMDTQTLVIGMISKFGNDYIKETYLPGLITGEITGAFAMSEASSGSDPSSLKASTEFDLARDIYLLSGDKEWVTNGRNADVFVVLAKSSSQGECKEVSAFIVDRKFEGIVRSDQPSQELHDCGFSQVRFENTPVPEKNVLGDVGGGYEVAVECLTHNRYFVITSLINLLKKTLCETRDVIRARKQYPTDLKDSELIQYRLAQLGCSIYALESTLYLFSGMIDSYNIDTSVEAATLQLMCHQTAVNCMTMCNEMLGGRSYLGTTDYIKSLTQVQGLALACRSPSLLKLYVSTNSIVYSAVSLNEVVAKNRNPFNFPGFAFKKMLANNRHVSDNPKLDLQLYMNLHPSLKPAAEILEYAVLRMQYAVETTLSRYGTDTILRQIDLYRMADVLTDIFAMTAVLSRASRSYCTGIQFCDQELLYANAFCREAEHRVRLAVLKIVEGGITSNDVGCLKVGSEIINLGGYFFKHPLHRNIK